MLGAILGMCGSILGKVNKTQKAKSGYVTSFSTTSTTQVSALNLTGKGRIKQVKFATAAGSSNSPNAYFTYQLVIDGRVVLSGNITSYNTSNTLMLSSLGDLLTWGASVVGVDIDLTFVQSLQLNVTSVTGGTVSVFASYELEQ